MKTATPAGPKFKAGDTVMLKSGGPVMTVVMIDSKGAIHCKWFWQGQIQQQLFGPASIRLTSPARSARQAARSARQA
jgi:uncharacterized protein YodC (DUF2158 family)